MRILLAVVVLNAATCSTADEVIVGDRELVINSPYCGS